jgi:prepilin-type N-terminal cleavage/methylation domain-containing protein
MKIPHPAHRVRSFGRGFSLVELIAVMVLIGIMGAVAVPAISRANEARAGLAAPLIARDLCYARDAACSSGLATWTVFTTGTSTYSMFQESRTSPGRAGRTPMIDTSTGRAHAQTIGAAEFGGTTISAVSLGGGTEIGFDWLGQPMNSSENLFTSDGTITLSNGRTITVIAVAGAVRVQ